VLALSGGVMLEPNIFLIIAEKDINSPIKNHLPSFRRQVSNLQNLFI
jgi:hypothetical protein